VSRLFEIACRPPWLLARFGSPQRIVSWSLNRPGFVASDTVAWLQVKNADLPIGLDPKRFLESRLVDEGLAEAVGLMTARDIREYAVASAGEGVYAVDTLVTLGLGNAVTLDPTGRPVAVAREAEPVGTINALVACSQPLGDGALLEAMSVATAARTAALLADDGRAIGTGTDCLAIACPMGGTPDIFAGLHTEIGTSIAAAVYRATREGRRVWEREQVAARRP
jgi:adenosylcobinamide amidohydrolase